MGAALAPQAGTARTLRRAMLCALLIAIVALVAIPSAQSGRVGSRGVTPHIDQVAAYLNKRSPGTQGKLWWITTGNTLPQNWLLQTPNCWGHSGACDNGNKPGYDLMFDTIQRMVGEARSFVDITSLWPPPDGTFMMAVAQGLVNDYQINHTVPLVRIMAGKFLFDFVGQPEDGLYKSTGIYLTALKDKIETVCHCDGIPLKIEIAFMRFNFHSWVHEKAIDVDGHDVLIGGMNYWQNPYVTDPNPVADVSMEVVGPAAKNVMTFDDLLWTWTCKENQAGGLQTIDVYVQLKLSGSATCVPDAPYSANWPVSTGPAMSTNATVMTVGHLGDGFVPTWAVGKKSPAIPLHNGSANLCPFFGDTDTSDENNNFAYEYLNPGEDALRALVNSATTSISISQQDSTFMRSAQGAGRISRRTEVRRAALPGTRREDSGEDTDHDRPFRRHRVLRLRQRLFAQ